MKHLIELLEQACTQLQPFTSEVAAGALVYDGTRYAPAPARSMDPYALAWWATFRTVIALLEGEWALKKRHREYLLHSICGGMGSFQDFSLDEARWGESAVTANKELERIRSQLFDTLS